MKNIISKPCFYKSGKLQVEQVGDVTWESSIRQQTNIS